MNDCDKCRELLLFYFDDSLSETEKEFVQAHTAICRQCAEEMAQMENLDHLMKQWASEEIEPPPSFHDDLMARLASESPQIASYTPPKSWFRRHYPQILPIVLAAILLFALQQPLTERNEQSRLIEQQSESNQITVANNEQALKKSMTSTDDEQIPNMARNAAGSSMESFHDDNGENLPELASLNDDTQPINNEQSASDMEQFTNAPKDRAASLSQHVEIHTLDWAALQASVEAEIETLTAQKEMLTKEEASEMPDKTLSEIDDALVRAEKLLTIIKAQDEAAYESFLAEE